MIPISDALTQIIARSSFLEFGLHYKLLNLTQVARFIRPQIEARTKKDVKESAILMALSRFQGAVARQTKRRDESFKIEQLSVQTDLAVLSLERSSDNHNRISKLYAEIQKRRGYLTICEGLSEITVIIENEYLALAEKLLKTQLAQATGDAAAIRIKFDPRYLETPGFLFVILQQLAFQGINLLEVASTKTEFILYLRMQDVRLAFDSLHNKFQLMWRLPESRGR
ncbi:MAG: hypothetical protein K1X83_04545 [Oligoflexia bacterium]|nr:hypothetical protein [Oligoflexia bacterium]